MRKALLLAETYNVIIGNAPSGSKIFRLIGGGSALHKTLSALNNPNELKHNVRRICTPHPKNLCKALFTSCFIANLNRICYSRRYFLQFLWLYSLCYLVAYTLEEGRASSTTQYSLY